jgi:exopolyphosphatase/guanosine-5'-triphosphate,3'-diphosphate pyrophosphatase
VPRRSNTLAVGPLRFKEADFRSERMHEAMEREFAPAAWLTELRGRPLHLVGGTWRALARLHMALRKYPLPIIHGHRLSRADAEALARLVAGLSAKTMRRVASVPRRRQETLPFGALALGRLIAQMQPLEVVFSAFGLREGLLYERLPASERARDPLLAGCRDMSLRLGRGLAYAEALDGWLGDALAMAEPRETVLRRAACLLADVSWRDHPDYRAEHAFHQVLRAPFVGLSHPERAFLAVAVSTRYGDQIDAGNAVVAALLTPARIRLAQALGSALRLAGLISHGSPELLARAVLGRVGAEGLRLSLSEPVDPNFLRRLERLVEELAAGLGLRSLGVRAGGPAAVRSA